MTRVLMVCMGNICRSPLAEGALRARVEAAGLDHAFEIDSAGTIGYHAGEPPDPRSIAEAKKHGIDISGQRSRKLVLADLSHYDYLFAMDQQNLEGIERLRRPSSTATVKLFLDEAPDLGVAEVPDPYYGARDGFSYVWKLVDRAAEAFLARVS